MRISRHALPHNETTPEIYSMSDDSPKPSLRRLGWQARILLALSVLWLAPTVACGSFAPRPTPTPTIAAPVTVTDPGVAQAPTPTTALVIQDPPTPTSAIVLTATAPTTAAAASTPTPVPLGGTGGLGPGVAAFIAAPNGLNMRQAPSAGGALIVQLGTGQTVTVTEGPTEADGFTWWRVDAGNGQSGWVAQGDSETVWLTPANAAGPRNPNPQPINRAPRVGDRVVVSQAAGQLSVRATPGTDANLLTHIDAGSQFTVLAGPQQADGFNWYQIRSDDGTVQGWVAEGDGAGTRWLSPLE
jgi:uncharacterized protein YgiM (DUF1202 family)